MDNTKKLMDLYARRAQIAGHNRRARITAQIDALVLEIEKSAPTKNDHIVIVTLSTGEKLAANIRAQSPGHAMAKMDLAILHLNRQLERTARGAIIRAHCIHGDKSKYNDDVKISARGIRGVFKTI